MGIASFDSELARWSRVELIVIDELGYVPLAEVAAELQISACPEALPGVILLLFPIDPR